MKLLDSHKIMEADFTWDYDNMGWLSACRATVS